MHSGSRDILLIGGWAQTPAAVAPLANALEVLGRVELMLLDRPEEALLSELAPRLSQARTLIIGWSLGGQLLLRAIDSQPGLKAGCVLLAANPCFVARQGWPGMDVETLRQFQDRFRAEPEKVLREFQLLQTRGCPGQRDLLRSLLSEIPGAINRFGLPQLIDSLGWLGKWDQRRSLDAVDKGLCLLGADDALVPAVLEAKFPAHWQVKRLEGTGHYPAESCTRKICEAIRLWSAEREAA